MPNRLSHSDAPRLITGETSSNYDVGDGESHPGTEIHRALSPALMGLTV